VALTTVGAPDLAAAMSRLLASPAELAALAVAARARPFRTWLDYAEDLTHWLQGLPIRR
jgi:hypothetical protein